MRCNPKTTATVGSRQCLEGLANNRIRPGRELTSPPFQPLHQLAASGKIVEFDKPGKLPQLEFG